MKQPIKWYIRLTLPIFLIVFALIILLLPVNFFITGKWKYNLKHWRWVERWMKALNL